MGLCKNCKHWRHIRDENLKEWRGPHGECHLIDDISPENSAWFWVNTLERVDGEWRYLDHLNIDAEASLITMPDFGCIHFERQ